MTTWENFHDSTAADFRPCERPTREPDFVSPSGSRYWHLPEGVVREADHWCLNIRSCHWLLAGACYAGPARCGFAAWSDFARPLDHPTIGPVLAERWAAIEREAASWRVAREAAPGQRLSARRVVRDRRGRVVQDERVTFTVARATACYIITEAGERFARSTLTAWEVAA